MSPLAGDIPKGEKFETNFIKLQIQSTLPARAILRVYLFRDSLNKIRLIIAHMSVNRPWQARQIPNKLLKFGISKIWICFALRILINANFP